MGGRGWGEPRGDSEGGWGWTGLHEDASPPEEPESGEHEDDSARLSPSLLHLGTRTLKSHWPSATPGRGRPSAYQRAKTNSLML